MIFVKLRYRFRFYPTNVQKKALACTFGAVRYVYNWALRLRIDSYHDGKTVNYNASSAALTILKKQEDYQWLNEISCIPTQQTLRHLQTAFYNFFKKQSRYPSFKKKNGVQSATYTRGSFKLDVNRNLRISKLGRLDVHWSRTFRSNPSTITIVKDKSNRYFVSLVLDEKIKKLPKTKKAVGVDLGISRLATLSNGERIPNPKYLIKQTKKLAKAQRTLSRRIKGSGRWKRAKFHIARIHAKIADARLDHMHKVTTDLVRRFDVICIEDLNVRGMIKNHNLARSISDASFGLFRSQLRYKTEWYSKDLRVVDRFFPSSKRCNICGHVLESLPLSIREWNCPECNTHHDRDENASKNILAVGHTVTARGGSRRPVRALVRKGTIRRTVNRSESSTQKVA